MKQTKQSTEVRGTLNMGSRPSYVPKETYDIPVDVVPAIKIIQSLSPERMPDDSNYISGALEGMMFNAETRELYDGKKGVIVVPLQVRKSYVEWIPRQSGGGFVAAYPTREEMEAKYTAGNQVQVSIEFLIVLPDMKIAVVRFDSPSKLGVARKWGAAIKNAETLFGARYVLRTVLKRNRQNQTYFNFDIQFSGWVQSTKEFDQYKALMESNALPILITNQIESDDILKGPF